MWRLFFIYFVIHLFVLGCATPTHDLMPSFAELMPPDQNQEQLWASMDELNFSQLPLYQRRAFLWQRQYVLALSLVQDNPEKSCELFKQLQSDGLFPLRRLAFLRALGTCQNFSPIELGKLEEFPQWMSPIVIDQVIAGLEKTHPENTELFNYYIKKSKLPLSTDEKINWTIKALDWAKQNHSDEKIELAQTRLYKLSPRHNPQPKSKEFINIANDYRRARDFKTARNYYQKVIKDRHFSYDQKIHAYKGLAYSYKLERDKFTYAKILGELSDYTKKLCKKNKNHIYLSHHYNVTLNYARALWTNGQIKETISELKKLEKLTKNKLSQFQIFWLYGRIYEEKGQLKAATFWFDKSLNEPNIPESTETNIRWFLAWNQRKMGQLELAIANLEKNINQTDNDFDKYRYQFWLAKMYQENNNPSSSQELFKNLIKEDVLGYYGLLAHRELGQFIERPQENISEFSPHTLSTRLKRHLDPLQAEWLVAVGELSLTTQYLDHVHRQIRHDSALPLSDWNSLFHYYAKSGLYQSLFQAIGQSPPAIRQQVLTTYPQLIFPTPHKKIISHASHKFGVAKELIHSIIRQESAFNPQARSHADAFGLMQVIPEVAHNAAKMIDMPFSQTKDLFQPEKNIIYGTAHLSELQSKYNQQLILTAAAYNASEQAIHNWMDTRFNGSSLEFIEDIPYEETRGYVRLVLRNLVFYKLIESENQKIVFPEWTLELKRIQKSS